MYLQITTKCNMTCAHCCFSCGKNGKHADYNTIIDAIAFVRDIDDGAITIGGGEPTLHPRFFDILRHCLEDFDYVWFATNGSQTKTMFRLSDILDGYDYENLDNYYTCSTEEIMNDYDCHPGDIIYQENKLTVALSQDYFHDQIDNKIIELWTKKANQHKHSGYEIRDVSRHVIKEGRAKITGEGFEDGCVCSDIMIKPNGDLKLCGCLKSPIIGNIYNGIEEKYQGIINNDSGYINTNCYKNINGEKKTL